MRAPVCLALLVFAVPVAGLNAVPVPEKRYQEKDASVDLVGTTWDGHDLDVMIRFVFEPGGTLYYSYKNGQFRNATWKLDGNRLYFEMNTGFREFRGVVQGDTIVGESWNVRGMKWSTTLKRIAAPK
jgi:hypothetical protein